MSWRCGVAPVMDLMHLASLRTVGSAILSKIQVSHSMSFLGPMITVADPDEYRCRAASQGSPCQDCRQESWALRCSHSVMGTGNRSWIQLLQARPGNFSSHYFSCPTTSSEKVS
jgi:hypothetical protein